ncbi:uncharacterized protein [Watersipora subatra]|uniref:uncharacterized protein isoform X2 n=1 Tax=Watersipora subatra TaxID=2589382 RepID=UPI00355B65B2
MFPKSKQEPASKEKSGARPKTVVSTPAYPYQDGAEGKGLDIAKGLEQSTKVPQQDYDTSTLLQAVNLMQVTERKDDILKSMRSSIPNSPPFVASAGIATADNSHYSCLSKQNCSSSYETRRSDSPEKLATELSSHLDDTLYTELDEETEQYIRRAIKSGLRLDATKVLRNIVELIMSAEILFRTTDSKNIIDLEKVKNRLREFCLNFSEYEKMLLDLLLEIEILDKVASELGKFFSFDGKQEDLLDATHKIKVALTKIGDKSTSENRAVSRYYISAVNQFRANEIALTQAAKDRDDQISGESFSLLQRLAFALKYGTLHEIIESMNVELKKLANGKLNGFLFYPKEDETGLRRRELPPFVKPKLAETIEDIFRKVVDSDTTEKAASNEITDNILDAVETLSNIFFSSYAPELKLQTIHSEKDVDYIECDISKVTKLVSEGYQKQHLGVVEVHKKALGVLHDHPRLQRENDDLRQQLQNQS